MTNDLLVKVMQEIELKKMFDKMVAASEADPTRRRSLSIVGYKGVIVDDCPFCGGTFSAGDRDGTSMAYHSLTPCETFAEFEPEAFIHQVKSRMEVAP